MKNKKFIKSLSIAFVIPVIVGVIYFKDMYNRNIETKVNINTGKPKIVYNDQKEIVGIDGVAILDSNYESASNFSFNVTYINGDYANAKYNLFLKDIEVSDNIELSNLKWKLLEYDFDKKEYVVVNHGDFSTMQNGILVLGEDFEIGLSNFQKFKLYYFIEYSSGTIKDYSNSTFKAKIDIE